MTGIKNLFPRASFVGFDHLFNELERTAQHAHDHYPPHNIIKLDETNFLIEVAVAGFSKDDIEIEVKDQILSVSAEKQRDSEREYVHKGISAKRFMRTFRLSEYVEVKGADIIDGILAIELEHIVPDAMRPRKVTIGKKRGKNVINTTKEKELLTE